jgi:hypothetical protein
MICTKEDRKRGEGKEIRKGARNKVQICTKQSANLHFVSCLYLRNFKGVIGTNTKQSANSS